MDAITRVKNAMMAKEVDRVPVGFLKHFPDQSDNTVTGQVQWALGTGMDFLTIGTDGYMEFASDKPLNTAEDWGKIRPHKKEDRYLQGQYDRAARIAEKMGDKCASFYSLFTPYSTIKHTIGGEEKVNEMFRENPTAIVEAMKVIEEDNALLLDMLKGSGILGTAISFQNAEEWRFTPEEYMEWMAPWDQRLIQKANENFDFVISHLCSWGCEPNHVCVWKDYDHMCANWGVHIERNLSLAEGRKYFTKVKSVMGGFDVRPGKLIVTGTEKEIKDYTKQLIEETGRIGLLISSDCSLNDKTPDQNIHYVIEATEEYEIERAK